MLSLSSPLISVVFHICLGPAFPSSFASCHILHILLVCVFGVLERWRGIRKKFIIINM